MEDLWQELSNKEEELLDFSESYEKEVEILKYRQYSDLFDEVLSVRVEFVLQVVQKVEEVKLEMVEDNFKKDVIIQEYEGKIYEILE